jgi:Na+/H+ antiporter NhaC
MIPPQFIVVGVFIISAVMALAIGSAMATVGAIVPIGIEMAMQTEGSVALMLAAIVCGAIFGDNLSMVSDTTIAATRTQGCELQDKFKVNFLIALPAALITAILFMIFGRVDAAGIAAQTYDYNLLKILPYMLVLVLALIGINVFVVLSTGIVSAIIIGICTQSFVFMDGVKAIYEGFTNMTEIFLLSMFTGGLAAMVTHYGGLAWALSKIKRLIKGPKTAQAGIAALAAVSDLATANNTVAIIIRGQVAKEIALRHKIDPRKSASLLDIWACVFQGIIPYGAQILLASGLSEGRVSPVEIVPYMWYTFILAAFAAAAIIIPYADHTIKKHPWDWETFKATKG